MALRICVENVSSVRKQRRLKVRREAHLLHERDIRRIGFRIEPFRGSRVAVQQSHLVDAVSPSRPAETFPDPPRRPVQDRVDRLRSRAGSEILRHDDFAGLDVAEDVPPRGTICKRRVAHSGDETGAAAWGERKESGFVSFGARKRPPGIPYMFCRLSRLDRFV